MHCESHSDIATVKLLCWWICFRETKSEAQGVCSISRCPSGRTIPLRNIQEHAKSMTAIKITSARDTIKRPELNRTAEFLAATRFPSFLFISLSPRREVLNAHVSIIPQLISLIRNNSACRCTLLWCWVEPRLREASSQAPNTNFVLKIVFIRTVDPFGARLLFCICTSIF